MNYLIIAIMLLPQLLIAQFVSQKNFVSLPLSVELNDSLVFQKDIYWGIGIVNYIDLTDSGEEFNTIMDKNISQFIVDQVLTKNTVAYPYSFLMEGDPLEPCVLEDGVLYETKEKKHKVIDLNTLDIGNGNIEPDLRNFFFAQNIYWNGSKLVSKITWIGIAKLIAENDKEIPIYLFRVPIKKTSRETSNKVIWSADSYFEQSFTHKKGEIPLLKKMFDKELSQWLWPIIEMGQVLITDVDGDTPLDYQILKDRSSKESNFQIFNPVTMQKQEDTALEFDMLELGYFGVLQHIKIYDDLSASVEIKGLKVFYNSEPDNDKPQPVGWVFFR